MRKKSSLLLAVVLVISLLASQISMVYSAKIELPDEKPQTQSREYNFSTDYTLTGDGATDMVAVAFAQKGKTGSALGYTEQWCADFVGDCAIKAGQSTAIPLYGSVSGLAERIEKAGGTKVAISDAKPGDICIFDWNTTSGHYNHVEIVYSANGRTVSTIGGNTGSGTDLYTRRVATHDPASSIHEIWRPKYIAVSPPSNPWILTNLKKVAVGENLIFTYGATGSIEGYAIGIDKVGIGRVETIYPGTYGERVMVFSEPGEYTAYITAFNGVGGVDSEKISFTVYDSAPKLASISTDKRKYAVYENIFVSVESDTANGYAIGLDICNAEGEITERLNTIALGDRYEPYDIGILPAGIYSAYVTAFNNYGGIDSEKIMFIVYESAPVWAMTATDKQNYEVGEKIIVTVSSDTAINYALGLDSYDATGEKLERIDTIELGDRYEPYDIGNLSAGYYSVYVTAINHYGWIDSPKAFFCVGHKETYSVENYPTLENTGSIKSACAYCPNAEIITVPKLNTTDYTKTTIKTPTCTVTGTDSYKWKTTTYGTFSFTVTTPAKGHTPVTDKAVAATCTQTGLTEGSHCSVCNAVIKAQETVAALGHSYTSKVTAPTCTAQGYTTYTCSRCSHSYKDTYTNASDHNYSYKATTNPTTSATGVLTGTCSGCSGTTTVTLPKLNTTDYTKTTTKAPTCTATGTDSYKWKTTTYGTFSFTVTTPAKGHTPVTDKAVAATCTASGLTEGSHCSVCNAVIKAQETVAALGHSYTSKVTAPTCTAQGYTTYTCSRCSHSYKDNYVAAKGHTAVTDKAVAATCTTEGLTEGSHCSVCNVVLQAQSTVAALGHKYEYVNEGDAHNATCGACGDTYFEAHSYTDGHCVCGVVENTAPVVDENIVINHTLNLASDISVSYVVVGQYLEGYEDYYLEIKVPNYEGNQKIGDDVVKLEPVVNGSYIYFTLTGVTAVQMNDELTATLHMTKGGKNYVSNEDVYSIATYAYNQLNKTTASQSLKRLCADLLCYGGATQSYKGYRTDALVTENMTAAHKAYMSNTDAVTFGNTNTIYNDLSSPLITWVGKTLNLDSKVIVKFVFDAAAYTGNISNLTLKLVYEDSDGIYQEVTLKNPSVYNAARRQYAFDFDGLMAAELRTAISAAVYAGDMQVSQTLRYSPDAYGNNKTGALLTVCKSLFAYSDSAKAYFTN